MYRTGQNLSESVLLASTPLSKTNFGQYCSYGLFDGEVYGQPLVVTNVNWQNKGILKTVVYIVTLNDSIWAFDGAPAVPGSGGPGTCQPLAGPVSLLQGAETVVSCANLGAGGCQTIAQVAGIVGTPVIRLTATNPATGNIYVLAESISSGAYIHRVWSLDITNLSLSTAVSSTVQIPNSPSCPVGQGGSFSSQHIQRPALLLGGDNYLYVAFSMMDGLTKPLPNGMILAYNAKPFTSGETPLCLATSAGATNLDGAGIWQGGAGPAYGVDDSDTDHFVYFNTGNGVFDASTGGTDYVDSFIKLNPAGAGLTIAGYSTLADQLARSGGTGTDGKCTAADDIDYGSGGVMLIPESDITWPYLALSGDKEGGLWFENRTSPGGYAGDGTCAGGTQSQPNNTNVETVAINGQLSLTNGAEIHNSPAYWKGGSPTQSYVFMSSHYLRGVANSGQLMRFQVCTQGNPVRNSTSPACTNTGAYAYAVAGTPLTFGYGTTPTISANGNSASDAIVWAIWADGSVVPNSDTFYYPPVKPQKFSPSTNGVLYAFDAANPNDP